MFGKCFETVRNFWKFLLKPKIQKALARFENFWKLFQQLIIVAIFTIGSVKYFGKAFRLKCLANFYPQRGVEGGGSTLKRVSIFWVGMCCPSLEPWLTPFQAPKSNFLCIIRFQTRHTIPFFRVINQDLHVLYNPFQTNQAMKIYTLLPHFRQTRQNVYPISDYKPGKIYTPFQYNLAKCIPHFKLIGQQAKNTCVPHFRLIGKI